jgi:ATP-dependent Clp protease adaptor protein ClpS
MRNSDTEVQERTSTDTLVTGPYVLILNNDDHNTFDWVIRCLMEICKHTHDQASQSAYIVHYKGRCAVKYGEREKVGQMKQGLIDRGLSATIETV